jgi:hypothetical protein
MKFAKKHKIINNKNIRQCFCQNEAFSVISKILIQSKYSNKLKYLTFKKNFSVEFSTVLKSYCIFTTKSQILTKSIKINEQHFHKQANIGNFSGFYKAI